MQEVKKIDMAFQQLEDALAAYFNGRYHSALVLAAAAEQLFAGYMHLHELENPKFEAQETIDRTISNFDALSSRYDLPILPLAQKFIEESAGEIALEADIEDVLSPVVKTGGA